MTETDLNRIETRLGIVLPRAYRDFMRTRAEELRSFTCENEGETQSSFDFTGLLYLDADAVINENLSERRPDSDTQCAFPRWSKTFFLIGTNGAGDYYCLRLKGDCKVWMIGSDCGDVPTEKYPSLPEFVDDKVRRHLEELASPSSVLSSFDASCPLMERFGLIISRKACSVVCREGDRPVTEEKLRLHGIDVGELGRCVLQVVAVLAKCDPGALTIQGDPQPTSCGDLMLNFNEPPLGDPRFGAVGVNIHHGSVYASVYAPRSKKAPAPKEVGIDWIAFRAAVTRLLQAIHPPGTRVTISEPELRLRNDPESWDYDLDYALE